MTQQLCPVVVGRTAELETLRTALAATSNGRGHSVLLVGEAGIGKSRLAREAAAWAVEMGLSVMAGRAAPGSVSSAYRPVTEVLLQLVRGGPLPDDGDIAPWLATLRPLIPSVADVGVAAGEVSPAVRAEALMQLLRRLNPAGSVIVFEDIHWADPDTLSVVEYLADNLAMERLALA